ncbi:MAG: hypothetical protein WA902_02640 [Thermosynechococcaceae cyanobacterium]
MNLTFLIQKEGDGEWLPLESPTVEVLEGRYHLIAHTDQVEYPIDIQIRHRYEEDGILQEELQQRRQQPDTHGSLSLLPISFLGRGLWTLSCFVPTESEDDVPHRQSINLQVLAEDCDLISDWEFMESTQSTGSPERQALWPIVANPIESSGASSGAWLVPADEIAAQNAASIEVENAEYAIDEEAAALAEFSIDLGDITQPLMSESQWADQSYIVSLDHHSDRSDAVRLPILPQEMLPVRLQRSQGTKLPPDLSKTQSRPEGYPSLDLPILPRNPHWHYLPLNKLPITKWSQLTVPALDIKQAFTSLELQQQFWYKVYSLIDSSVSASRSVLVGVAERSD